MHREEPASLPPVRDLLIGAWQRSSPAKPHGGVLR